jgi:T-complex protein 1 subunit theta
MDFGQSQLAGLISGTQQDEKARYHVVAAKVRMNANLMRNIFGKSSHTKLIQNSYGKMMISSQPSVIYENTRVNHPLVKLLHEGVRKMDEIGDGASFFVLLVSELLSETLEMVNRGVKPALLAAALRVLHREIDEIAKNLAIAHNVSFGDRDSILRVIQGVIKNPALEELTAEAVSHTRSFDADTVRICKVALGSVEDSYVVEGMVFSRSPEGEVKSIRKGRTSIYNCPLDISRTELKGTVLMKTAEDLLSFSKDEVENIRRAAESIKADVVICNGKVNGTYLDFMNQAGKLVFKVLSKHDLRRIWMLMGGHISSMLVPQDESYIGSIDEVTTFEEGGVRYTKFISESSRIYTLVLKNSVGAILDEQERIVLKALTVLHRNTTDGQIILVEGAGRFEAELAGLLLERAQEEADELYFAYGCLARALRFFKSGGAKVYDCYNGKLKALKYALDFMATMYETSDYLIGRPEALNISPRTNKHWDEDDH